MTTAAKEFFSIFGACASGGLDDLNDMDFSGAGFVVPGGRVRSARAGDFTAEEIQAMELLYGARIQRGA